MNNWLKIFKSDFFCFSFHFKYFNYKRIRWNIDRIIMRSEASIRTNKPHLMNCFVYFYNGIWWASVMSDDRVRVKHTFWLFSILERLVSKPKHTHLFIIYWKLALDHWNRQRSPTTKHQMFGWWTTLQSMNRKLTFPDWQMFSFTKSEKIKMMGC